MQRLIKLIISFSILFLIIPTTDAVGASNEGNQEEFTIQDEVRQDFDELLTQFEQFENYKITLRYLNVDTNELLAEGEIIGDRQDGNAQLSFDMYEYDEDSTPIKTSYDILSYGEFSLAYINVIELLDDTGFFNQRYFTQNVRKQIELFKRVYVPIEGAELASINLNEELFTQLLYLPNLDQIGEIADDNIYQLNESTIIDMERIEIPRGFFQNAGSFSLNYNLDIAINEMDNRLVDYEVIPTQQFTVSENSNGLTIQTNLESHITNELINIRNSSFQTPPEDYSWESDISTNHVTDKLTKVTIAMNPTVGNYSATLTGLYEEFMLNIFSNETADIESFNYRLELDIAPTNEKIPSMNELDTMTMTEFSYLMEKILTEENSRYNDQRKLQN